MQKQPGVALRPRGRRGGVRAGRRRELRARWPTEGQWRDEVPAEVALVAGPARSLLLAERTALNFLAHLSGVATLTARFVEAVRGSGATILDTRKTTPGLRALEKAAVAAGGGRNHRFGLDDAILIKENHVAIAGGIAAGGRARPRRAPGARGRGRVPRRRARSAEALDAGSRPAAARQHEHRRARAPRSPTRDRAGADATLEASGGVTLDNVAEIAATGVELISIGALTHSAPALDLSMLREAKLTHSR